MERFTVSRDDSIYEAFPDLALTASGRLVCVFSECTHHRDRSYTRIAVTTSDDRGRTWSRKRGLTEALRGDPAMHPYWNCPRINRLADGRLVVVVDRITGRGEGPRTKQENVLFFSRDDGNTWDGPHSAPAAGIVPDKLIEVQSRAHAGRWIMSAHTRLPGANGEEIWAERCWFSDDRGETWSEPVTVASRPELMLCEGSIVELPSGELVCFLRENSGKGLGAFKVISRDSGETWSAPIEFPLPGCHRPTAGMLQNGLVIITYRFMQGGGGWIGWWTQNFFAALTDVESCLAETRDGAHTRIRPVDFDRHPESDTGYSGWVEFPDGELYIVNYILDDAPKAQIRGYSLTERDFLLPATA